MITLNLTEKQQSKINAKNLAAFEANYNLNATLYYIKPCFVLKTEQNEFIFRSAEEFNGWLNGAINAIYQLNSCRIEITK